MTAMTKSQTSVGCLVCNVALGREGKAFQRQIELYLSMNGAEWTCNRLKAVWNIAILLKNDDRYKAKKVLQQNSIAYHKDTLYPKGIEGRVVQRFVEAQRPSVLKRLAAAMRFYTSITVEELTPKQRKKALNAISGPNVNDPGQAYNLGKLDLRESCSERNLMIKPLLDDPLKDGEIHAEHLKALSKYYSRYPVPKSLRGIPYSSMAMSFMTEPWVPYDLDSVTPCQEMRMLIRDDSWFTEHPQQYAGKISVIQEQGCKARVVCQPSAWLQLAFMPLHNRVARIAEALFPKESCVKDQVKGADALCATLSSGGDVYCTDLSSATDRFPVDYTIGVLDSMGYGAYANALRDVCSQKYKCDFAPTGEIQYSVGQPMGLYGSFPLFHLSNMLMADAAVRAVRAEGRTITPFYDGSYFKTVGDDIIFSDWWVSRHYRFRMEDFGVEISEAKSFSGKVGEFAGFLGISTSKGAAVFRPYKVPAGEQITNGIQFVDSLGSNLKRLSPKWDAIVANYEKTISSRDLALEPLVDGDEDNARANSFRGDNREMINMCNQISMLLDSDMYPLPDLSGNTKINRSPLFHERRTFDHYGYDPDAFKHWETTYRREPLRGIRTSIGKDPLIREVRDLTKGVSETPQRLVAKPKQLTKATASSQAQIPSNLSIKALPKRVEIPVIPKVEPRQNPPVEKSTGPIKPVQISKSVQSEVKPSRATPKKTTASKTKTDEVAKAMALAEELLSKGNRSNDFDFSLE